MKSRSHRGLNCLITLSAASLLCRWPGSQKGSLTVVKMLAATGVVKLLPRHEYWCGRSKFVPSWTSKHEKIVFYFLLSCSDGSRGHVYWKFAVSCTLVKSCDQCHMETTCRTSNLEFLNESSTHFWVVNRIKKLLASRSTVPNTKLLISHAPFTQL